MTTDQFREFLMRTVAEARGKTYDKDDTTLLFAITVEEAAKVLRRSKGCVYHYVSDGILTRANERRAAYAEFDVAELTRCARLIGTVRDPHVRPSSVHPPHSRPNRLIRSGDHDRKSRELVL